MTYIEAHDRAQLRKAVRLMHELAMDELMAEDLDNMFMLNLDFFEIALTGVLNESSREELELHFNEMEIEQLRDMLGAIRQAKQTLNERASRAGSDHA